MSKQATQAVTVWDPLVRVFHWGVVGAFLIAFLTSEDNFADLHVVAGYTILALVAVRLVWGVIGTRHARFSSFVVSPAKAIAYLKDLARRKAHSHVGHNPAAAYMILALLAGLALTGITGMMAYGVEENAGPLAGVAGTLGLFGRDFFEELHEVLAWGTLGLAGLHVCGVLFSSLLHRENLIAGMLTGVKILHPGTVGLEPAFATAVSGDEVRKGPRIRLGRVAGFLLLPVGAILIGALVLGASGAGLGGNKEAHAAPVTHLADQAADHAADADDAE